MGLIDLFCFHCRARREYRRLKGFSRPVYACIDCKNTREIEVLGVTDVKRAGDPLETYVRRTDTEIEGEAALARPQQRPDLETKRRKIMARVRKRPPAAGSK